METRITRFLGILAAAAVQALSAATCHAAEASQTQLHKPPPLEDIAKLPGDQARLARLGLAIVTKTGKVVPELSGNQLSCSNCHLDSGRAAWAVPLWAAWVARAEDGSFPDAVQSCFTSSMGAARAPARNSETIAAIAAYSKFLATGLPEGSSPLGRRLQMVDGIVPGTQTSPRADPTRGEIVWQRECQVCHGADGNGNGSVTSAPPTWGPGSYTENSAMAMICCSSGFIKKFMPFGKGGLSDQDALDVAAFINSKPRGGNSSVFAKIKSRLKVLPPIIWARAIMADTLASLRNQDK